MDEEVERWIPTLAAARRAETSVRVRLFWNRPEIDLLDEEPDTSDRLAAILLVVRQVREPRETIFRYPYVPSIPFPLEEGVARVLEGRGPFEPPEALRVELEPRRSGDPYRGMPGSTPSFRGFDYADALPQARRRIAALRATHPAEEIELRTFAWPFVRLSFRRLLGRQELVLIMRPDGVMHAMLHKRGLF